MLNKIVWCSNCVSMSQDQEYLLIKKVCVKLSMDVKKRKLIDVRINKLKKF